LQRFGGRRENLSGAGKRYPAGTLAIVRFVAQQAAFKTNPRASLSRRERGGGSRGSFEISSIASQLTRLTLFLSANQFEMIARATGIIHDVREPLSPFHRFREGEETMDKTSLLIIVIVLIVLLSGGGWYGRGRWF
jgi:hypothetical protein